MLLLRFDVDYAYPSRFKSFVYTALKRKKPSNNYLKNSKIIAKMINESPNEVKAYWFFTPYTLPDKELLELLNPDRHEVALHVANNAVKELEELQKVTGRKINYYTIHGTERLFGKIIWGRKLGQSIVEVPEGFSLKSFYKVPVVGLDRICYEKPPNEALKEAQEAINAYRGLHMHPEWLFQRGTINPRGPCYETLKRLLMVDQDLERVSLQKQRFFLLAKSALEYNEDVYPTDGFLKKLAERNVDLFTFVERSWISKNTNPEPSWAREMDNVGLLQIISYEKWLKDIVKKTRHNMVRRAEKFGVRTEIIPALDDKFVREVWKIYNETPIRQNRAFPHYGISFEGVKNILSDGDCLILGAYIEEELVGYAQIKYGKDTGILFQLLSLQRHWEKAINNALIARAVKICEERKIRWLIYGRMETAHPSLDSFKRHNGFVKFPIVRFYVPLSRKGRFATAIRAHRELKNVLPISIKYPLIPLYSWVSRTKIKIKLKLKGM